MNAPPTSHRNAAADDALAERVRRRTEKFCWRLKLAFAAMSVLGSAALSTVNDSSGAPMLAMVIAIVGWVMVDWLEVFALPAAAAYALMSVTAAYCVGDFLDFDSGGNRQIIAVAQMLAFVQSILMLQTKTVRIFEQLTAFCALELLIAAVFGNTLTFGLFLILILICGAIGLAGLAAVHTAGGLVLSRPMAFAIIDGSPSSTRTDSSSTRIDSTPAQTDGASATSGSNVLRLLNFRIARAVPPDPDDPSNPPVRVDSSNPPVGVDSPNPPVGELSTLANQRPRWLDRLKQIGDRLRRLGARPDRPADRFFRHSSDSSIRSVHDVGGGWNRWVVWATLPSLSLVGLGFFYFLPRVTDAATSDGGAAMVGYNSEVDLDQIGRMNANPAVALRLSMTDRRSGQNYRAVGPIYLRGQVLERYQTKTIADRRSAQWASIDPPVDQWLSGFPVRPPTGRAADQNFFDEVHCNVTCESSRDESLFIIAPAFQSTFQTESMNRPRELFRGDDSVRRRSLRYTPGRGRATRMSKQSFHPRAHYDFDTTAYRRGKSLRWTYAEPFRLADPRFADDPRVDGPLVDNPLVDDPFAGGVANGDDADPAANLPTGFAAESAATVNPSGSTRLASPLSRQTENYLDTLLDFESGEMPTLDKLAAEARFDSRGRRRDDYELALALEQYLALSPQFRYTLDLSMPRPRSLDPIEHFVSQTRAGHCQYFASALVMMLRAQKIPARLVVGYSTDDYNDISSRYIARGSHAHAWVEALLDADQIPPTQRVYGQPRSTRYWLRLDPTPPVRAGSGASGDAEQLLDLANNMFDDYVVEMDASRQNDLVRSSAISPLHRNYSQMLTGITSMLARIESGDVGGGGLSATDFSITTMVVVFVVLLGVGLLVRYPLRLRRRRRQRAGTLTAQTPKLEFYRTALAHLATIGVTRRADQTPGELSEALARQTDAAAGPMGRLTEAYYQRRFGADPNRDVSHDGADASIDRDLEQLRILIEQHPTGGAAT